MIIDRMFFVIFFSASLALVPSSLTAAVEEYPEANFSNILNAQASQRIEISNPLFFLNLAQPLVRVTLTTYTNDDNRPPTGFVAVTHSGYRDEGNVTYYYQALLLNKNKETVKMQTLWT